MFTLTLRDHVQVAHSLRGEVFGIAQRLHGTTFVVDVTFRRVELDGDFIVVDAVVASEVIAALLGEFAFRNLDELPAFAGVNTTTEYLAKYIADAMATRIDQGVLGDGARALAGLTVTRTESPVAGASYDRQL